MTHSIESPVTSTALFTFGTLMDDELLYLVCQQPLDTLCKQSAVVHHHVRRYVQNDFYPVLVERPGEQARGIIIRGLSAEAMRRIIFFEGEEFSLGNIEVECENGQLEIVRCFLDNHRTPASDQEWLLEQWQRERKYETLPRVERYMQCYGVMSIAQADAYW